MTYVSLLPVINRVIHPSDALAPVYQKQYGNEEYFRSALGQLDIFDQICRQYIGSPLSDVRTIADFACHYGRLTRALRVAAPEAQLVACDIDEAALEFCGRQFSAERFHSAWSPEQDAAPPSVDLLICLSLVTHTRLGFFTQILELWRRMLRPGGLLIFTFLGGQFLRSWQAGEMAHYGPASSDEIAIVSREFMRNGHAFHGYPTAYSSTEYGIGFLSEELMANEIRGHTDLEILEIRRGPDNGFGQDLVIARKSPSA
jgi:SAM-dependent methyltransferase